MNYAYEIFRLFYPERCAACGRSLPEGARLLCPALSLGYAADGLQRRARQSGSAEVLGTCAGARGLLDDLLYAGECLSFDDSRIQVPGAVADGAPARPVVRDRAARKRALWGCRRGRAGSAALPALAEPGIQSGRILRARNRRGAGSSARRAQRRPKRVQPLAGQNDRSQRTLGQREGHFLGSSPRIARRPPSLARGRRADYRSYARGLRRSDRRDRSGLPVSAWRRWPFRLTSFSAGKARAACRRFAHRDFVGRSAGGFLFFRRRSRPTEHMSEGPAARCRATGRRRIPLIRSAGRLSASFRYAS